MCKAHIIVYSFVSRALILLMINVGRGQNVEGYIYNMEHSLEDKWNKDDNQTVIP